MIPILELAKDDPKFNVGEGAGILLHAKRTGRFLFVHRSRDCNEPLTWAVPGGKVDPGEKPRQAAIRELWEEVKLKVQGKPELLYIFKKPDFKFYTYLVQVKDEVTPKLNWESLGYKWCSLDDLPKPLHSGVKKMIKDKTARKTMESLELAYLAEAKPTKEAIRKFKQFDSYLDLAGALESFNAWFDGTSSITAKDAERIRYLYSITPYMPHKGPVFRAFLTKHNVVEDGIYSVKAARHPAQSWTISVGSAVKFAYNDGESSMKQTLKPVVGQLVSGKVWELWNYDWAMTLARDLKTLVKSVKFSKPKKNDYDAQEELEVKEEALSEIDNQADLLFDNLDRYDEELEVGLFVPKNSRLKIRIVAVLDWTDKLRPRK